MSGNLTKGLFIGALGLGAAFASPAGAADRCMVTDPTGTPLNIRDQQKNIIGTIPNGRIVVVRRVGEDNEGKPWALVMTPAGRTLGWVYREFISCY
ncbi:MAG: SH3 domain-containing protein [Hyphomicrobiales bacterium]|jgi:hypothetical protein|nr:MAG: SH3 domain-containing protein [Hyphomicrobiales bacterium]